MKNNIRELAEETILPKLRENKIDDENTCQEKEKILIKLEELTQEMITEESNELNKNLFKITFV